MKLHLPKEFLKAVLTVMAAFVSFTVQAADTISINFTNGTTGQIPGNTTGITGTLEGIGASGWQNINAADQTNTSINNQAGTAAGAITIANVANSWESKVNVGTTLDSYIQKGYIDTPNSREQIYTVAVDHEYWVSDVVFYMSADTANDRYSSLNVNGTNYYGSEDGAVVGNQAWGATGNPAGVTTYDHNNSFKVTGLVGDLVVKNNYSEGAGQGKPRATLAGLQIIDRTAETVYFTTLGTGETALTDATWSLNGGDAAGYDAETMNYLGVNAAAEGSTLVLNSAEDIDLLGVKTGALTLSANANTTLGHVFIDAGAGLDINTAENITVSMGEYTCFGSSVLTKSGDGTLNMGALSNGKVNVASFNGGITVNGGILQYTGTSYENWPAGVEPAFVQLLRNVTTTGTGKVQVVGDVCFSNQSQTEATIAIDDNIEVTGNLRINSIETTTGTAEADGKKYRLWNIATGGTLTVGEQLWLTNKQKLTLNGGSLNAGSIKLGHEENGADAPYPSRIVVESGSLKTGDITFCGSGNSFTMTGGSLEFTGSQAFSVENGGNNGTFSISSGTLKATESDWTLASGNGVTVTVGGVTVDGANTHGITLSGVTLNGAVTNNKTLTLENVTVAGNVNLTNSGTLTVNGSYSSNGKIENTAAAAVINFNGDVTFSAGSGNEIYGVKPGYVITGSGTTNFTGSSIISGTAESPQLLSVQNGAEVVVGGGKNTTTMTLGQLRLHDGSTTSTETFTIKDNAVVTITAEDASGTGGSAVVLGHWHNGTAKLQVAGGQLNVLNGSIRMGWDSNSIFSITDGEANVAKITFRQNEDTDRLTLTGGRLNVGAGGIIVEAGAANESHKANTSVELNGGKLGVLYSEGAENQGWTLDGRLTTTIGTLTVDTTAVNADGTSSGTGATITIQKASTASSGTAITLAGSGSLVIQEFVAGTGASTFGQQEGSSATMTVNSLTVNAGASLIADNVLTVGSLAVNAGASFATNNALTIGGTIVNDGSLTLNGTIYLSGDIDTSFAHREQGSSSYVDINGEASTGNNGFLKLTSASYWLTQSSNGEGDTTINFGDDFATLEGNKVIYQGDSAFQLDKDTNGQLYFSTGIITGTQYYISSGDVEITSEVQSKATGYTLQGGIMQLTEGSVNTSKITYTSGSIELSDGAQLKVDAMLGNKTAADLLTGLVKATPAVDDATPTGKLVIATDGLVTGNANLTTTFKGTLELAEGISFTLGAAAAGSYADSKEINTTSLTGLVLNDGSTLKYTGNGVNTQFANTTVNGTKSAATFHIFDGNENNAIQFTGETLLNNELKLTSDWGARISIAQLAGNGTLTASGANQDEMFYTTINSLNGFTGTLDFTDTTKHTVVVNTGTAAKTVSFTKLQFATGSNLTNTFNVQTDTTVGTISGTSTINIAETGTLHAFTKAGDGTITLLGSGTYDLGTLKSGIASATITNCVTMGNGSTDAEKWKGSVKISGGSNAPGSNGSSVQDINFNNLGQAGSTVEIGSDGVYGYLQSGSNTYAANIKFAGDFYIQNSYTSGSPTATFSGNIVAENGGGNIVVSRTNAGTNKYKFTGDVSGWNTSFTQNTTGGSVISEVIFAGAANSINAAILNENQGTLNLEIDTTEDATLSKDVNVSKIVVNNTAKLTGENNSITAGNATIGRQNASLSNVTVQGSSIAATVNTNGAKGSMSNADVQIAQLAADASFTIQDMTLTNTTITAATVDTHVDLKNVSGDVTLKTGIFGVEMTTVGRGGSALTYEEGAPSITLSSTDAGAAKLMISANPTVDVRGSYGTYTLTFNLNLQLDSSLGEPASNEAWGELVGFSGWLGTLLEEQGAVFAGAAGDPVAQSTAPSVSYGYSAGSGGSNVGTLVITINGLNVPEPTTSTLSLLALAGLCARRRRR